MENYEAEDKFIRTLTIAASTLAVLGVLSLATVVTVLVGANFNVLSWLE